MSDSLEDLQILVNRALEMPASNAVHQDTIARAKRLVPLIQPQPLVANATARDSNGQDIGA